MNNGSSKSHSSVSQSMTSSGGSVSISNPSISQPSNSVGSGGASGGGSRGSIGSISSSSGSSSSSSANCCPVYGNGGAYDGQTVGYFNIASTVSVTLEQIDKYYHADGNVTSPTSGSGTLDYRGGYTYSVTALPNANHLLTTPCGGADNASWGGDCVVQFWNDSTGAYGAAQTADGEVSFSPHIRDSYYGTDITQSGWRIGSNYFGINEVIQGSLAPCGPNLNYTVITDVEYDPDADQTSWTETQFIGSLTLTGNAPCVCDAIGGSDSGSGSGSGGTMMVARPESIVEKTPTPTLSIPKDCGCGRKRTNNSGSRNR